MRWQKSSNREVESCPDKVEASKEALYEPMPIISTSVWPLLSFLEPFSVYLSNLTKTGRAYSPPLHSTSLYLVEARIWHPTQSWPIALHLPLGCSHLLVSAILKLYFFPLFNTGISMAPLAVMSLGRYHYCLLWPLLHTQPLSSQHPLLWHIKSIKRNLGDVAVIFETELPCAFAFWCSVTALIKSWVPSDTRSP